MSRSKRGILIVSLFILAAWIFQTLLIHPFRPSPYGLFAIPAYYMTIIFNAGIGIILAVSLNLVSGFTGQFSMGHAGFMSVGAYSSAFLSSYIHANFPALWANHTALGLIFIGCLTAGGMMSALVGYVVGLPTLRLKGDYLAIVTLGFGEIIRVVLLNMESLGGARGMDDIPGLSNFGWIYTAVALTIFSVARLIHSAHGRSFMSVREDEIAAEAMGVNTTRAKVKAFVIGSFLAGIAGGLFAHEQEFISPVAFDFNKSFEIIIMVVLGGMGSITGSAVAAVLLTVLREALRPLQEITKVDLRMVIYSLILIIMMLNRPNGLFGRNELSDIVAKFRRKKSTEGRA